MNTAMQYLQQALALSNQMLSCMTPDKLQQAQALGADRDRMLKLGLARLSRQQGDSAALQAVIQDIMAMDEKLKQASEALARQMTKPDFRKPDLSRDETPQNRAQKYQKRVKAYTSQAVKKT